MCNSYFSSPFQLLPIILMTSTAPFIETVSQKHYIIVLYLQATSSHSQAGLLLWTMSSLGTSALLLGTETLKLFPADLFLYSFFLSPYTVTEQGHCNPLNCQAPNFLQASFVPRSAPSLLPIKLLKSLFETENSSSS